MRAPCIEWSEDGFAESLLPSLPGIPGWTRVIKFVTGALPAESSWLTALFLLLNQHLHTFTSPPLSFFVCACMSLHLCLHAYVADVRNHLQSAAVLFFVVGPQSNTDLNTRASQLVLEIPSLLSQATTPTWHLHGSGDLKSGFSSCLQDKHISPAPLSVVKMPKSPFPRILAR